MNPPAMTMYAELCGRALAKAHARSGDAIAIASYLGAGDSFDRALASFAEAYADQNERDYNALREAVASGRARGRDRPLTARGADGFVRLRPWFLSTSRAGMPTQGRRPSV